MMKLYTNYVINNMKEDFINVCNSLIESYPYRIETITEKKEYILNNWKSIKNLYENKLKCPMESQISHTLAELLTSRPKGYSLKTLEKILKIRLLLKNKHNIKKLYLNNYNKEEILTYKKDFISFKLFEREKTYKVDKNLIPETYHHINRDNSFTIRQNNYLIIN